MKRPPDFVLPGYLRRWHLIPRNRWFNIYLHNFIGSDPGFHRHDHPWWSLSIILSGGYCETRYLTGPSVEKSIITRFIGVGRGCLHRPTDAHRIAYVWPGCWTIFVTGPTVREWGFWVDGKWVHHELYSKMNNPAQVKGASK